MFRQLLVGGAVSLVNIAVHSVAMAGVVFVFKRRQAVQDSLRFQVHLVLLMIAVVLVLNMAHLVEVAIWALLYSLLGVAPSHVSPFYFAFMSYDPRLRRRPAGRILGNAGAAHRHERHPSARLVNRGHFRGFGCSQLRDR